MITQVFLCYSNAAFTPNGNSHYPMWMDCLTLKCKYEQVTTPICILMHIQFPLYFCTLKILWTATMSQHHHLIKIPISNNGAKNKKHVVWIFYQSPYSKCIIGENILYHIYLELLWEIETVKLQIKLEYISNKISCHSTM